MVTKIVLVNPKGGSGKTTIATNIAAYFASQGRAVTLIDHDAQGSSSRWIAKRPDSSPAIHAIEAFKTPTGVTRSFAMRIPPETERIVVDTSAALTDQQITEVTRDADRVVVPVVPSDIDIHAATRCIADLLLKAKIGRNDNRLAVVANRVKPRTIVFRSLMRFLKSLDIPIAAFLRDTQNYIRSAESGLGVHELKGTRAQADVEQWAAMIDWLEHGKVPNFDASGRLPEKPTEVSNVTSFEAARERRASYTSRW